MRPTGVAYRRFIAQAVQNAPAASLDIGHTGNRCSHQHSRCRHALPECMVDLRLQPAVTPTSSSGNHSIFRQSRNRPRSCSEGSGWA